MHWIFEASHDQPVNEGGEGMVIRKRHKIELRKPSGGSQTGHSLPVLVAPTSGIDVAVVSKVVEVLYQTTTEANLQRSNNNNNMVPPSQGSLVREGRCWYIGTYLSTHVRILGATLDSI